MILTARNYWSIETAGSVQAITCCVKDVYMYTLSSLQTELI